MPARVVRNPHLFRTTSCLNHLCPQPMHAETAQVIKIRSSLPIGPLSGSFLGLPYRILNINHKKELLRGLWVVGLESAKPDPAQNPAVIATERRQNSTRGGKPVVYQEESTSSSLHAGSLGQGSCHLRTSGEDFVVGRFRVSTSGCRPRLLVLGS